jgi:hypothetical protein
MQRILSLSGNPYARPDRDLQKCSFANYMQFITRRQHIFHGTVQLPALSTKTIALHHFICGQPVSSY